MKPKTHNFCSTKLVNRGSFLLHPQNGKTLKKRFSVFRFSRVPTFSRVGFLDSFVSNSAFCFCTPLFNHSLNTNNFLLKHFFRQLSRGLRPMCCTNSANLLSTAILDKWQWFTDIRSVLEAVPIFFRSFGSWTRQALIKLAIFFKDLIWLSLRSRHLAAMQLNR